MDPGFTTHALRRARQRFKLRGSAARLRQRLGACLLRGRVLKDFETDGQPRAKIISSLNGQDVPIIFIVDAQSGDCLTIVRPGKFDRLLFGADDSGVV